MWPASIKHTEQHSTQQSDMQLHRASGACPARARVLPRHIQPSIGLFGSCNIPARQRPACHASPAQVWAGKSLKLVQLDVGGCFLISQVSTRRALYHNHMHATSRSDPVIHDVYTPPDWWCNPRCSSSSSPSQRRRRQQWWRGPTAARTAAAAAATSLRRPARAARRPRRPAAAAALATRSRR